MVMVLGVVAVNICVMCGADSFRCRFRVFNGQMNRRREDGLIHTLILAAFLVVALLVIGGCASTNPCEPNQGRACWAWETEQWLTAHALR